MASYSVAEAKNQLPKLLDRALAGEEVVVTRRGKAIARIVPESNSGMRIDLEWLDRVRVKLEDPTIDFTAIIREMRDERY